ncbi:MAG: hypothetical protein PH343_05080 [Nitrospira sp.]|nr:hypothetical protein [Nitrospira sp.]
MRAPSCPELKAAEVAPEYQTQQEKRRYENMFPPESDSRLRIGNYGMLFEDEGDNVIIYRI